MKNFLSRLVSHLRSRSSAEHGDPVAHLLQSESDATLVNMVRAYLLHLHLEQRRHARWQQVRRAVLLVVMLSAPFAFFLGFSGQKNHLSWFGRKPIVAVVDVRGTIEPEAPSASSGYLLRSMRGLLKTGRKIEEIVIRINSPGGSPAEAVKMADLIDAVKKETGARVTVFAGDAMASAAYIIALRANTIVVSEYSLVGSIGAIIKSWDASELMSKLGIREHVFASGQMKDMLSPTRTPGGPEREKAMAIVGQISDTFVQDVVRRRADRLRLTVDQLKTGEVWTGTQAVEYGLADQIGTFEARLSQWEEKEILQIGEGFTPSWTNWIRSLLTSGITSRF